MIYVEDCDHIFKQAISAGAKEKMPIKNQFYGDRSGTVQDPYGFTWHVSTHIEDLSNDEMKKRSAEAHN